MSETKDCFSERINTKLNPLKQLLAKARMPSSKMEKKGKKIPVNSNRSFDHWDVKGKDLLIGDPDDYVSACNMFELYDSTLSSITINDVIKKHELSETSNKSLRWVFTPLCCVKTSEFKRYGFESQRIDIS